MNRNLAIQIACLYAPLLVSILLLWFVKPKKKQCIGLLYATLWVAALLPWINLSAVHFEFWSFQKTSTDFAAMPLSLYLGWVFAWGVVGPLLSKAVGDRPWLSIIILLCIDLRLMPELAPLLILNGDWYIYELVSIIVLLIPAIYFYKWTAQSSRLHIRCAMLALTFGGILLGIPTAYEIDDLDHLFATLDAIPVILQILITSLFALSTLVGLIALNDLASGGKGTPVPFEPPKQLVTHGIYSYLQNPMQLSMTLLLLIASFLIASPWPAMLALVGFVYSEGLARWSENKDMQNRFGSSWVKYSRSTPKWIPRYRPILLETCHLYYTNRNSLQSRYVRWLESSQPVSLLLTEKGDLGKETLIWYDPATGRSETKSSAIAMSLQHVHIGYACLGWTIILLNFRLRSHEFKVEN